MSNEKINVVFPQGQERAEVVIREVEGVNELPVKPHVKIGIVGTIGAVREFLEKRVEQQVPAIHIVAEARMSYQVPQHLSHILVDREKVSITLITNEHDEYLKGSVVGKLTLHPKYIEFGINTGRTWEPHKLGDFFKMNRAFFPDKTENMSVVNCLKSFKANVDVRLEKEKKENGNWQNNYSGIVSSNLPASFRLKLAMFKGQPAMEYEVETYASIDGKDVEIQLFSPSANQMFEEMRDDIINAEIAAIRQIAPGIAIIEQ